MIWLVGNRGMLGRAVEARLRVAGEAFLASDREVDITDLAAVEAYVARHCSGTRGLDWIINCAAYTAVDRAEAEEDLATTINGTTPGAIAAVSSMGDLSGVP